VGSGLKNKNKIDMGNYIYNKKDFEAYRWCLNNNIYIAPLAKSATEWYIDIINNGKTNRDPVVYRKTKIWEQIYKYYNFYYDKYRR